MPTGVVKKWNGDRGFGFLTPDDGGDEVFVHMKALQDGNDYLTEGEAVEYEEEFDDAKGKMKATSCSGGYNGGEWTPPQGKGKKGSFDQGCYGKGVGGFHNKGKGKTFSQDKGGGYGKGFGGFDKGGFGKGKMDSPYGGCKGGGKGGCKGGGKW